jgi:hypothetical protein
MILSISAYCGSFNEIKNHVKPLRNTAAVIRSPIDPLWSGIPMLQYAKLTRTWSLFWTFLFGDDFMNPLGIPETLTSYYQLARIGQPISPEGTISLHCPKQSGPRVSI